MVSAFSAAGAFGRDSEKGMPPVRVIWRRYISMAVAIGMPSCFSTSSACCLTVGLTRRLSVIVFSMVITSTLSYNIFCAYFVEKRKKVKKFITLIHQYILLIVLHRHQVLFLVDYQLLQFLVLQVFVYFLYLLCRYFLV